MGNLSLDQGYCVNSKGKVLVVGIFIPKVLLCTSQAQVYNTDIIGFHIESLVTGHPGILGVYNLELRFVKFQE